MSDCQIELIIIYADVMSIRIARI